MLFSLLKIGGFGLRLTTSIYTHARMPLYVISTINALHTATECVTNVFKKNAFIEFFVRSFVVICFNAAPHYTQSICIQYTYIYLHRIMKIYAGLNGMEWNEK